MPVLEATIPRAIELNGAAIEMNKNAFLWGAAAVDLKRVEEIAAPKIAVASTIKLSESLDEMIERRTKFLTDYQDAAYAKTYSDFVPLCVRRKAPNCRANRPDRSGRALLLQAACREGRVRSRPSAQQR